MRKATLQKFNKSLSTVTMLAFVLAPFAMSIPMVSAATTDPTTNVATSVTATDATLNGLNGTADATGHSFWVSTSTFSTASPVVPTGVYSTIDLGAIASSTAFSALLSSITGILPITAGTTYYYAAWSNVGGVWSPGAIESFTTISAPTITTIAPSTGSTTGGTAIAITGTQFATGATVTIGGVAATSVVVVSDTSITATTPAGIAGVQDVVVTNTDTGTVTSTGGFTYTTTSTTAPTTDAASGITTTDATLNGTNGSADASNASFWVSTSTFSTAVPVQPAGVYSTVGLGAVASSTAYAAQLSAVQGLPTVTAGTTYYYAAWSEVGGVWSPGAVHSFTTASTPAAPTIASVSPSTGSIAGGDSVTITGTGFTGTTAVNFGGTAATTFIVNSDTSITATSPATSTTGIVDVTVTTTGGTNTISATDQFTYNLTGTVTGGPGVLSVTSITPVQTSAISDNTFTNGWSYLFNITVPTNETHLAMKFADWLNGANILPVASNMQISSLQAASTTPITLTAANLYSTPTLDMTGDLSTSTAGLQVQVLVQVKVPVNTANGAYTTSYGVRTL